LIFKGTDIKESVARQVDVVVVGSGAGGATAAAKLAERGLSVIVVEEGSVPNIENMGADYLDAARSLYRHHGISYIHGKAPILMAEGMALGGSTVINTGACWRTPSKILRSWRYENGLFDLTPDELAPYFLEVEKAIGTNDDPPEKLGRHNELLLAGAEKLGYHAGISKRNAADCKGDGRCAYGCPSGAKKAMHLSFIPRADEAGADIYADCRIDRLIVLNGKVGGVEGRFLNPDRTTKGPNIRIHCKAVVLACGALGTVALLLRSEVNDKYKQTGRHLFCQPIVRSIGRYPDPVRANEGVMQGSYVDEFLAEGMLILAGAVPPELMGLDHPGPGDDAVDFYTHNQDAVLLGAILRDSGEGRVRLFRGDAYANYEIAEADLLAARRAAALMAELLFASGASEVITPFAKVKPLASSKQIPELFNAEVKSSHVEWVSLHPMGTCRMGTDRSTSVVNSEGRHHDVPNLYIADASLIPSALGVPPQLTVMALAARVADRLQL
jgi:choline dehydrogenase-like flavoprotein